MPRAEVAVRVADLHLPAERLAELLGRLSPDERRRAGAFHRPADRDRYVAARGLLRELLAQQLGLDPADVPLVTGQGGKPALDPAAALGDLRFNASRSGRRAVFAWARAREVGVDVERERDLDLKGVAARTFTAEELSAWRALEPAARTPAFFAAWARKEAYAKGRGEGLALGMQRIRPTPTSTPGRHVVADPEGAAARWTVVDVDAGEGYAAAVGAEGEDWQLRLE